MKSTTISTNQIDNPTYVTQTELQDVKDHLLILQKTVDKHQELNGTVQDHQNRKLDNLLERMGRLEQVFGRIVDTFKNLQESFQLQNKQLEFTVEDTLKKELKPIDQVVEQRYRKKTSDKTRHPSRHWWRLW